MSSRSFLGVAAAFLVLVLVLVLVPGPAAAATPYDPGRMRVGLTLGGGTGFDDTYFVAGGSFGVFVLQGLEVAADGQVWLGGSPFISTVSPRLTYVFHFVPGVQPYLGAIYRHWFINDAGDLDMLGGRGGVFWGVGPQLYLSAGIAYEHAVAGCDDRQGCYAVYPELAVSLAL